MAKHLNVLRGKKGSKAAWGAALAKGLPKSLLPKNDFVCACEPMFRPICEDLPFYAAHEGKRYCVLHFPGQGKATEPRFHRVIEGKLEGRDFRFGGVYFPESVDFESYVFDSVADFSEAIFEQDVNFSKATFKEEVRFGGATYKKGASFAGASFTKDADFLGATFEEDEEDVDLDQAATFDGVTFEQEAIFSLAKFGRRASFVEATFEGNADFSIADFQWTWFDHATFKDEASFSGACFHEQANFFGVTSKAGVTFFGLDTFAPQAMVSLQEARIESPELFSFRTIRLRPGWFINVDPSNFDFVNVQWYGLPKGPKGGLKEELEALQVSDDEKSNALGMLSKVYHSLAVNAEEHRRYMEAAEFRYWAMDTERKRVGGDPFAPWSLTWWYWALSGYGERPVRSLLWLVGMLIGFAALYVLLGFVAVQGLSLSGALQTSWQAVVYSLGVMTRQNPTLAASESVMLRSLVFAEGILGPLQIGLFALALRRKFMR